MGIAQVDFRTLSGRHRFVSSGDRTDALPRPGTAPAGDGLSAGMDGDADADAPFGNRRVVETFFPAWQTHLQEHPSDGGDHGEEHGELEGDDGGRIEGDDRLVAGPKGVEPGGTGSQSKAGPRPEEG